jgi:hypothetical protein
MQRACAVSVASQVLPYFTASSHEGHDFRKNVIEHHVCVLIFPTTLPQTFLILKRIERDIVV